MDGDKLAQYWTAYTIANGDDVAWYAVDTRYRRTRTRPGVCYSVLGAWRFCLAARIGPNRHGHAAPDVRMPYFEVQVDADAALNRKTNELRP